jgi:hypothetical protein
MLNLNLRRAAAVFAIALILNLWPTFARADCARVVSRGSAHSEMEIAKSVNLSFNFLNTMMDAYASGDTVRLIQSYSDQLFGKGYPVAFTYDNAVAIQAYLAGGCPEELQRATVLGNSLIHAQANNFPFNDGRFAQAYYVGAADSSGAYITPAGDPFYLYSSTVGDQAWAGMALAQLYDRTDDAAYLTAALKTGNWIVDNAYDTQGPGGYRFGTNINQLNQSVPSTNGKSTEHNIDVYAFFTMLAKLTHNGSAANGQTWASLADHALTFVQAMYNTTGGFFYTGTNADQVSIFTDIIAEDAQMWSYLALRDHTYAHSIHWVTGNLITADTPAAPNSALIGDVAILGVTFGSASLASLPSDGFDSHAVWLEGTGNAIAALFRRAKDVLANPANDEALRLEAKRERGEGELFLSNISTAQAVLGANQTVNNHALTPGQGIVAATGTLDTGFGQVSADRVVYLPRLHIGATGWYVIAAHAADPFKLGLH